MELSPLLYTVWHLAALEAVRADEEQIQPDHFFLAALKTVSAYERWKKDGAGLPKEHHAELDASLPILNTICAEFRAASLDPDQMRNKLRESRGHGQHHWPEEPSTVHRSPASHRLLRRADELAGAGSDSLQLTQLLLALLEENLLEEGGKRFEVLRESGVGVARLR